jgi:hypothetical protein
MTGLQVDAGTRFFQNDYYIIMWGKKSKMIRSRSMTNMNKELIITSDLEKT